jgi:sucrose-6-phosphate hydrolase SacC (GH32 family)
MLCCGFVCLLYPAGVMGQNRKAPAPLFRDPVTDGAADPVLVWNRQEKSWWMLYTQRRANAETADVAYCHGNSIGIAETKDNGQTWVYRGTLALDFERGHNTFWAPDVVYHNKRYHLFTAYIQGVRNHWGGVANLVHYTSKNLWDWKYEGTLALSSDRVIDATLFRKPDGLWRIWYKDEKAGSVTMTAESKDLKRWNVQASPAIGGEGHEGAKVFRLGEYYWMLTDEWHGMRVYRSTDLEQWEKQGLILDKPGTRRDDTPTGAHGDVLVVKDKAYVFYFTHPGRATHEESRSRTDGVIPYELRRSGIQVAPLRVENGTLVCNRDDDFDFYLPDPE